MSKIDVVIPYRRSKTFDKELRYALRSWSNYSNLGKIWLIGEKPDWVTNVEFIPLRQTGDKSFNTRSAIKLACKSEVSEDFILSADDIYVTKPMDEIELYHGGTLVDFLERYNSRYPLSYYTKKIEQTINGLPDNPNHYELHVPMVINKKVALSLLANDSLNQVMFRTLYGNLVHKGQGTYTKDVKYYERVGGSWYKDITIGFLSSDDSRFRGEIEHYLKKLFPDKSKFETRV